MKIADFHERPLARNSNPYVSFCVILTCCVVIGFHSNRIELARDMDTHSRLTWCTSGFVTHPASKLHERKNISYIHTNGSVI